MADIAKCEGTNCPMKETCYRFVVPAEELGQAYFLEPPIKDDKCEYYWNIRVHHGISSNYNNPKKK
jgi:hypothetical protein